MHTVRGIGPLMNYEIGNTLSELANLHGERSLHIDCMSRYERVVDGLKDGRDKVIRELDRKDRWVLVDLRPLHKALRYSWYTTKPFVRMHFLRNDLVLITPTEDAPVENRKQR